MKYIYLLLRLIFHVDIYLIYFKFKLRDNLQINKLILIEMHIRFSSCIVLTMVFNNVRYKFLTKFYLG